MEEHELIKELFYKQVKNLTLRSIKSFDYQFSDKWIGSG